MKVKKELGVPYPFFNRTRDFLCKGKHFWDTQYKNTFLLFFALIKKIFLQTLVEIIFRYHKILFQGSGTPLGPPTTKMKIFACEVMGIKIE